jgi:hypothetical protein
MKKQIIFSAAILALTLSSCDWAIDKSQKAVNKAGEIVGKTGSEFGDGLYKGVKKTFENEVKISDQLIAKGIDFGEITINGTDSTSENILTIYVIFNADFNNEITVKLLNENKKEYGRITQKIKGQKGTTQYVDFIFDKRVNIGTKGSISID